MSTDGVAPLRTSPFKGLVPFDDSELDARFFFGRERETELVAANLMASRLTVLYGPSGVGKTSLLRAGVIRHLRAHAPAGAGGGQAAECAVIVDGWRDDPVAAIATAAVRTPEDDEHLVDVLAERTAAHGGELYLILDQMEEYFLYHGRRAGGPLADQLAEIVARPDLHVHVLLGIRDDALAELDAFKARLPGLFGNVLRLDHLDREAARAAILGPPVEYARLGGLEVSIDPALVDPLLDQVTAGRIEHGLSGRGAVGEESARGRVETPYLQLVLERLWRVEVDSGSPALRLETLQRLGGAEQIVQEHLERALDTLDAPGRELASRLFNQLVTPSGSKIAHSVGDLARYAGDGEERLHAVLRSLSAERIVRPLPGRNGGAPRFEIFHDVLADAVLAWRARHETELALAREREEARRRHRKLAVVAGVALAALAVTAGLAVYAFSQRQRAEDRARTAKARELTVASLASLAEDPELSLLLALEAAQRERTPDVDGALRSALVAARGRRIAVGKAPLLAATLVDDRLVTAASGAGRSAAAFSRSGDRLVEATGPDVRVVTTRGTVVATLRLPAAVVRVATGGESVAAAAADGTIVVAAVPGGAERFRTVLRARPTALALSGDGDRVVAANGKIAYLFDVPSGRRLGVFGSRSTVLAADLAPDGSLLATTSQDGGVRMWNAQSPRLVDVLRGHTNIVRAVAFTPDGGRLVTGSADRTARIWRVLDGHTFAVLAGHTDEVRSVGVSQDGALAVTASADGSARVWDAAGDPELRVLFRFARETPALIEVERGAAIVNAGDVDVRIDVRSGRELARLPAAATPRTPIGVTVEGKVVRVSRAGGDFVLRGHRDDVTSVRESPDGARFVTASTDHDVRVWDARTGSLLRVLKAHSGRVADARFSPDGRWIVTAGPGAAGVWNAESGLLLFYLRGHSGPLTGAAFASDARTIATSGEDGTVRAYRCDVCGGTRELIAIAERRLRGTGRRLTEAERARYLGD